MSEFLLVRHAQSTWNATGRWQGQADPPLSGTGEELTVRAGRGLREHGTFELVVTSDLERARRTGEILAGAAGPDRRVVIEPALREFHVGRWSGLTRTEIAERWPSELAKFDSGQLPGAPGGETRAAFDERVGDAVRTVAALISSHRPSRTLIVTHGGVIRSIARRSGIEERHIRNLAGYSGTAHTGGLCLGGPVDLLAGESPDRVIGPLSL